MKNLAQKSILILGLGHSGLALARWCVRHGAAVTVSDTRERPPQLAALELELPQARFVHRDMTAGLLAVADFDRVLKSPGLAPAQIARVAAECERRGIPIGNELTLFAEALAELKESQAYSPQIIAITGTNGKTTVTSLTGLLVARAGRSVAVAGNIGPSLLDTLSTALDHSARDTDAAPLPEVWVLELSSFQLDCVTDFEPTAATILNISQDHLDWHRSLDAYRSAKEKIYGTTGVMLLNRDDAQVMSALAHFVPVVKGKPLRPYLTFGGDEPQRPGDYGIETVNGMAWLVRATEADETLKRRKTEEVVLHIQRLMPLEALRIQGRHNATNALAALALAVASGCALAPMLHGLREYRGEPHRVESLGALNGVEYFDDSKGTNVGATAAALAGLGTDRKLVLILGGEGKGQDFLPLAEPVERHARAVVLIGRDAMLIKEALSGSHVPLIQAADMAEAVKLATEQARSGDAVLMSPACASFDMFDNYEHRARVFCDCVETLMQEGMGQA